MRVRLLRVGALPAWSMAAAAALVPLSAAPAGTFKVVDGPVEMALDPAAPDLSCVVVKTSGDMATDKRACARAVEATGTGADFPEGTAFYGDAERHPAECRIGGERLPDSFRAACAAQVAAMRKARFPKARNPQDWLKRSDLKGLAGPGGWGVARLGVDPKGRAIYCILALSSGNPALDSRVCDAMRRRARWDPALDSSGKPTWAVDHRPFQWVP